MNGIWQFLGLNKSEQNKEGVKDNEKCKEIFECPICYEQIHSNNICCAPCSHSYCQTCYSRLTICAICRNPINTQLPLPLPVQPTQQPVHIQLPSTPRIDYEDENDNRPSTALRSISNVAIYRVNLLNEHHNLKKKMEEARILMERIDNQLNKGTVGSSERMELIGIKMELMSKYCEFRDRKLEISTEVASFVNIPF